GDAVAMFQPLYDAYLPLVRRAGGVPRLIGLQPPDWRITAEALAAADGARLIIVNDPLNPTATVMSAEERRLIAEFCARND
ncbi:aminotransferase class I/II-fold pyridoxal phosphate-dependent enzyme, partial [Acinetobacter baumannii]